MKINQTQTTLELQGCPSVSSVISSTYPLTFKRRMSDICDGMPTPLIVEWQTYGTNSSNFKWGW